MDTEITIPEKTITISENTKRALIFGLGAMWGGVIAYNQIFPDPNKQPTTEGLMEFLGVVLLSIMIPIVILEAIRRKKLSE